MNVMVKLKCLLLLCKQYKVNINQYWKHLFVLGGCCNLIKPVETDSKTNDKFNISLDVVKFCIDQ